MTIVPESLDETMRPRH